MKLSTVLACALVALLSDNASAGLLRVPKVYNALITTNEKLVPSRAIPISAPVLHPISFGPVVPGVVVTSPYINVGDLDDKSNKTETEPKPEEEKKPEDKKQGVNNTAGAIPVITPFSLPLAYYNSITYYHNLWPYSYASVSPASFVFTAPFTYPGIFGDIYGTVPWNPLNKQDKDSSKTSDLPEGAKDDAEKDSVSTDS
ncbi:uncharacterized protein [Periplaneta americana]|uniref:uncharacterized protein n=1 Tax=Periplaneta americana TaxID=6978 RepID=UPI0037E82CB3